MKSFKDEVIQVKRRFSEDTPREKWESAFRYWTRQDDLSKPVEISEEMLHKPVKRSARDVLSKRGMFVGTNLQNLRNWARKIIAGRIGSVQLINKRVMELFCEKRSQNEIVHDIILRKWAIDIKNQIDPTMKFKASSRWATKFKCKYNIVSRNITHKVGKGYWKQELELKAKAAEFVNEVKQVIQEKGYQPREVINFDQSSFNKEIHSSRTLTHKGEKQVYVTVGSKNAATHSYMIMPFIDAAGGLSPILYLKIQETTGKFPITRPPPFQITSKHILEHQP